MFTQTLSDLTLDWSEVRSDKLLCVNTALEVDIIVSRNIIDRMINAPLLKGHDNV